MFDKEEIQVHYFYKLTKIWQDSYLFESYEWESTKDQLTSMMSLMRLEVVTSIKKKKKNLLSIIEVFSKVCSQESCWNAMLDKKSTYSFETTAMVVEATTIKLLPHQTNLGYGANNLTNPFVRPFGKFMGSLQTGREITKW